MSETPYSTDIFGSVESFDLWINDFENQTWFCSVQEAYRQWLIFQGFQFFGDDYTVAVTVILVFLSRCIANPKNRRYLSNPPDEPEEYTLLQVNAQEPHGDLTFWEFLTEVQFHKMYSDWRESRSSR